MYTLFSFIFTYSAFSIPLSLFLSKWLSRKFYKNSKRSFFTFFYSSLGIVYILLNISIFKCGITHGILGEQNFFLTLQIATSLTIAGFGLVFGILALLKPLEFVQIAKNNKKYLTWITCILFSILLLFKIF